MWVPTTCPPQASWMYSWISHRDDRPGEPAHRLLRRVAGRLPAAVPGRVPGGADAGCSAPHRPTARSPAVVDLGAASVQQLTTDRADPPLGEGVRSRCPHWRPQDPDALGGEDRIEGVGDPGVPVAQQEPERLDAVRQVHEEGTGLLGDPFPGWVGRHAEDVDPAIGDLQHEQHVQALEQDGLSMEEVAGQDPFGLGGQELLPGQAGAARCRVDTASFEAQPHRAWCEVLSKPGKFTVDAPLAPRRVVGCHRQDQATQLWHRRGPTGLAVRERPAAFDQVPMPAQHCLRCHESMEPMLLWKQAGQRREDGPVWPKGAWSADLSAQDRDLVAQAEDLGVLGCLRSGQQSEPAEELAEDQVEDSEAHAGDDRGPPQPEAKAAGQRHRPGFRHLQAATPGRSGRRLRRGRGPWRLVGG